MAKPIYFSTHARTRIAERGTTEADVRRAINEGTPEPARSGCTLYRLNLQFDAEWGGKWYNMQQVAPVVAEQAGRLVVVTVYVFYY
ncbi:MAG: DUF4258 domain-containing protein [Armatimonadetes bacterium]|nr:DUF4258 domain-containing protein [Armatimonadota bacterium]